MSHVQKNIYNNNSNKRSIENFREFKQLNTDSPVCPDCFTKLKNAGQENDNLQNFVEIVIKEENISRDEEEIEKEQENSEMSLMNTEYAPLCIIKEELHGEEEALTEFLENNMSPNNGEKFSEEINDNLQCGGFKQKEKIIDRHHNLPDGYQSERENNGNGNKSTTTTLMTNYLTLNNVQTDVENAKVQVHKSDKEEKEQKDCSCCMCGNSFKFQFNSETQEKQTEEGNEEAGTRRNGFVTENVINTEEQIETQEYNHAITTENTYGQWIKDASEEEQEEAETRMIERRKKHYKVYTCAECHKQFDQKSYLKQHLMIVHGEEKPYSCDECHKQFGWKNDLKRHSMTVHRGMKPYSCKECHKNFSQKYTLKRHMLNIHGYDEYHEETNLNSQMNYHPEAVEQVPNRSDLTITKAAEKNTEAERVIPSFAGIFIKKEEEEHVTVNDEFIDYKINNSIEITNEQWTQNTEDSDEEEKTHQADLVQQQVVYNNHFLMRREEEKKEEENTRHYTYSCKECHKQFIRKSNFERHMDIFECYCKECDKQFDRKCALEKHVVSVHESYNCKECQKKFGQKSGLERHVNRVHRGVKPYSCLECQKKFSQKSDLERHMNVHSGIKPYSCSDCKQQFTQKGSLREHTIIFHSGVKPFSCNVCQKPFGWKSSLKKHVINVHSGIKPYSCNECQKKFGQKRGLERHVKSVHRGVKLYSCKKCHKNFNYKGNLKEHMISVHRDV